MMRSLISPALLLCATALEFLADVLRQLAEPTTCELTELKRRDTDLIEEYMVPANDLPLDLDMSFKNRPSSMPFSEPPPQYKPIRTPDKRG